MKNEQIKNIKNKKRTTALIALLSLMVLVGMLYSIRGTRMYLQWPYYYVTCGLKAPVATSELAGARFYSLPGQYHTYSLYVYSGLYCTEQEAAQHYSKYPY